MNARLHSIIRRWPVLSWLLIAVLALAGVKMALDRIADRHLHAEVEQAAMSWAQFITRSIPDLELVFLGSSPSAWAHERLAEMRHSGDVFGFLIFDVGGRLMLSSDSLGRPPASDMPVDPVVLAARDIALAGGHSIQIRRGDGALLPQVYSEAYIPLYRSGQLLGVIALRVDQTTRAATVATAFQRVGMLIGGALLVVLCLGVWLARQQARLAQDSQERILYLAQHDVLTGTVNRAGFLDALHKACRRRALGGRRLAVLCVNLDGFKEVNDSLGHAAGDEMLRQVASRLSDVVRTSDVLARLGGDEFAILLLGVDDGEVVATLAQRIVAALAQPYTLAGQSTKSSASVGAAVHGVDGEDPETLMHHADLALYRAKTHGRDGYSFYDPALDRQLQDRRELTRDLRAALASSSLKLHFQPLFANDGRTLQGYEALARWPHPTRGFVSPAEFVPLAEANGLIDDLGCWVLHEACAEAATWPQPLSVAVNLSPAQFLVGGAIVADVRRALAASGLDPRRLEVEITESLLMNNTDQVLADLQGLHQLGVRVAMDDFGTGYSSLAYLWRFPFDKLKIDRAFTQNLGDDAKVDLIVRSIVTLAHSMGIRVNAEGVETPGQLAVLREHGCDQLQGFLLGRPAPSDRLVHVTAVDALATERVTLAYS